MASQSKLGEGLTIVTAHKGRDCGEPNNKKRKLEYKSVQEPMKGRVGAKLPRI